jgi:excisionase family DNA binding protein
MSASDDGVMQTNGQTVHRDARWLLEHTESLTIEEAALVLNVSRRTIERQMQKRAFPARRLRFGGRLVRFATREIQRMLTSQRG